jgi:large subunit ribosomal protein L4
MELPVLNIQGKPSGIVVQLSADVFGLEKPSTHAIYLDTKLILANRRQGTHKTKDRSEVAGSTRKLFRQKGTGGARRGAIRSGLLRGGGTVHGPKPRDYGFKLNKKVRKLARFSALTIKAQTDAILVVENFTFATPKTKDFLSVLGNLQLLGTKVLLVTAGYDSNVYLSGRNLPKVHILNVSDLNTYDIMNADKLLLVREAVELLNASATSETVAA